MLRPIDLPTLQTASLLACATLAAVFLWQWWRRPRDRWFAHWAANLIVYGATLVAFEAMPAPRPIGVTALLLAVLAAGNILTVSGVRLFDGRRPFATWMLVVPAGAALGTLLPGWLGAPGLVRVGESCGLMLESGLLGCALLGGGWRGPVPGRRLLAATQLGYGPGYLVAIATELWHAPALDTGATIALLLDQVLLLGSGIILLAMPGERALAALRADARRDALTGIANRAWLEENRDAWTMPGTAVVLIDVDHFKAINDGHGHAAGDAVLAALAARLRQVAGCAPDGAAVRLGGDEFLLLLRGCSPADAAALAEAALEAAAVRPEDVPAWTTSIGLALVEPGETRLAAALGRADAALYRAKLAGRARLAA